MKKVIFENGLKAFLVTFCFLLLGAVGAIAQGKLTSVAVVPGVDFPPTPSSSFYDVPQGIFFSGLQATNALDGKLLEIKDQLMSAQNDPATFNALLIKYKYFGKISEYLQAGATTPNAIAAGLWIFLESAEMSAVPISVQQSFKQEAIDLLS